jgi:hypothetical protein
VSRSSSLRDSRRSRQVTSQRAETTRQLESGQVTQRQDTRHAEGHRKRARSEEAGRVETVDAKIINRATLRWPFALGGSVEASYGASNRAQH